MSKASRDKGKRGEREFERLYLEDSGLDYTREQDGRTQGADFRVEHVCIDVKRRETLSLPVVSREIEERTPEWLVPAVAYRKNGEPWRVSLPASDFIELVQAALA